MPFFYNYTGPYPGTLRLNRANQPPATPQQPVNPWFAPPPQPAPAPAPAAAPPASNCFYYYPRYDPQPAPAAQPQAPVNPWLVPEPVTPKASPSRCPHSLHFVLQTETDDIVCSSNQHRPTRHRLPSTTPVTPSPSPPKSGMDLPKPRLTLRMRLSPKLLEHTPQ